MYSYKVYSTTLTCNYYMITWLVFSIPFTSCQNSSDINLNNLKYGRIKFWKTFHKLSTDRLGTYLYVNGCRLTDVLDICHIIKCDEERIPNLLKSWGFCCFSPKSDRLNHSNLPNQTVSGVVGNIDELIVDFRETISKVDQLFCRVEH